MTVFDLKQTGLELKQELQSSCSSKTAQEIALRIEQAVHPDGKPLTNAEKEHLINYIEFDVYDHVTGKKVLFEADNSEFLKLVAVISNSVNKNKK